MGLGVLALLRCRCGVAAHDPTLPLLLMVGITPRLRSVSLGYIASSCLYRIQAMAFSHVPAPGEYANHSDLLQCVSYGDASKICASLRPKCCQHADLAAANEGE